MTEPIQFDSSTPRLELPLLASGQAQKELFVNEALARIDMLLYPVVESKLADPPVASQASQAWIVAAPASGDWAGEEDEIVSWDGWQWTFARPQDAISIYCRTTGARIYYIEGCQSFSPPTSPTGGAVADLAARAAIDAIVGLLATVSLTI